MNRDILRMAAMLHDVGKVGITDVILKKPARLTPEEYQIMQYHTSNSQSEIILEKKAKQSEKNLWYRR